MLSFLLCSSFIWSIPIWRSLVVHGWIGGIFAGIVLGSSLIIPWFGASLGQTVEHQDKQTPRWMTIFWPQGKPTGRMMWKGQYAKWYKVSATLVFTVAVLVGIFWIQSGDNQNVEMSFPIFLGITFIFGVLWVEHYFRRHYTQAKG